MAARRVLASRRHRACEAGFTLIELMTVLVVLGVLASVVVPSLRGFAATQAAKTLAGDLAADLMLARGEALKRSGTVTVARSGTDWNGGWTVTANGTELAGRSAYASSAVQVSGAPASIVFNQFGRVATPSGAVRVTVSAVNVDRSSRCLALDLSGRVRAKTGSCT